MPTAAENRKPPATAVSEIGAGQPNDERDARRKRDAGDDSGDAAADAEEHRLGEKLQQHMQPPRADRHAQADFARPLGHRHQQDVHDADAADEQRDRGDRGKQKRHDAAAALGGLGDTGSDCARRNR